MAYNFLNFSTYCRFEIQTTSYIEIEIYDIVVKEVRNLIEGKKNSGETLTLWHIKTNGGITVPSGICFCAYRENREVRVVNKIIDI